MTHMSPEEFRIAEQLVAVAPITKETILLALALLEIKELKKEISGIREISLNESINNCDFNKGCEP